MNSRENVKQKREALNCTQTELAAVARIYASKICRFETGLVDLTDDELRRIGVALHSLELLRKRFYPIPLDFSNTDWLLSQIQAMNVPVIHQVKIGEKIYETVSDGSAIKPMSPQEAQAELDRLTGSAPGKAKKNAKAADAGD